MANTPPKKPFAASLSKSAAATMKAGTQPKPAAKKQAPKASTPETTSAPKGKPINQKQKEGLEEAAAIERHMKLIKRLNLQSIIIGGVAITFVMAMPAFQTRYYYHSLTPEHEDRYMVPLSMPNLTDKAIRLWAASSVTEILTFGFGDYDTKLITQRERFTSEGWTDFVHSFLTQKIGESVRKSQLVLTTIPEEDPTIVSQGPDENHVYAWHIKIPINMTFATNNSVTKSTHQTVTLTIVRVPPSINDRGMAIDAWRQ